MLRTNAPAILVALVFLSPGSTTHAQGDRVRALAEIERLGGTVHNQPTYGGIAVYLSGTKVRDADLQLLRDLPDLRILSLSDTTITDAGLAHIKPLTGLRELDLRKTDVTPIGLSELKKARPGLPIEYTPRRTGFQAKTFLFALLFMVPTLGIGWWFMWHSIRARQQSGIFPANIFVLGLFLVVVGLVLGGIGMLRSFGVDVNLANLF